MTRGIGVFQTDAKGIEFATVDCQPLKNNHDGANSHAISEHVQRM